MTFWKVNVIIAHNFTLSTERLVPSPDWNGIYQYEYLLFRSGKLSCVFNLFNFHKQLSSISQLETKLWFFYSSIRCFGIDRNINNDYILIFVHNLSSNENYYKQFQMAFHHLGNFTAYHFHAFHVAFIFEVNNKELFLSYAHVFAWICNPNQAKNVRISKITTLHLDLFDTQVYVPNTLKIFEDNDVLVVHKINFRFSKSKNFAFLKLALASANSTVYDSLDLTFTPSVVINKFFFSKKIIPIREFSFSMKRVVGVTCYTRPTLNFEVYVKPFDTFTWSCIILNGLVLCAFIRVYMYYVLL